MKKKHYLIIIIAVVALVSAYVLLDTLPLYPDFQRELSSYQSLKNAQLDELEILLPDNLELNFEEESYFALLDGRTLNSNVTGFRIEGKKTLIDNEVTIDFYSENDEVFQGNDEYVYKDYLVEVVTIYSDNSMTINHMFSINNEQLVLDASSSYISNGFDSVEDFEATLLQETTLLVQNIIDQFVN